jgi:outer membrane protein assembly factor BamB
MVWSTVTVDVAAGVVFAATGNNYSVGGMNSDAIHAIDLAMGTRVWRTQVRTGDTWGILGGGGLDTDFGANPILTKIGDREVVAGGDKGSCFWVLDRMTGTKIWDVPMLSSAHTANNGGVLNNGASDGTRFYVAANQPPGAMKLHALNVADGMPAWPAKEYPKVTWGMPSVANGVLFVPVNDTLKVLNAATGDELNSFETGGSMAAGAPAIAGGMVVVKSGMQYVFGGADAILNTEVRAYGLP